MLDFSGFFPSDLVRKQFVSIELRGSPMMLCLPQVLGGQRLTGAEGCWLPRVLQLILLLETLPYDPVVPVSPGSLFWWRL